MWRLLVCALAATPAGATLLLDLRGGASKLKTDDEKSLYALGCNVGRQIGDLDCFAPNEIDTILMGVKDTVTRQEFQVNLGEALPKAAELFKLRMDAHLAKVEAAGKEALEKAAAEKGAVKMESGLVMKQLKKGDGESPGPTDVVKVHYEGKLPEGSVFDSSISRGEPVEFPLNAVVAGWQEGLQLMKPGGKAKLTIPADLGYGDAGKATIPPKATLIFEVELIAIVKKGAPDAAGEDDAEDDEISV